MARQREQSASTPSPPKSKRREILFLVTFLLLLGTSFALVSWKPVNDGVIEPFTAGVARASAVLLNVLGQDVTLRGTVIQSPRFAVNIRNGCNGVETVLIFLSAVLAFPAPWRSRLLGLGLGILAIQAVNLVRVAALFLTGVYFPKFFDASHTLVWQSLVILFGVVLWIFWASRFALPKPAGGGSGPGAPGAPGSPGSDNLGGGEAGQAA
ncbi:MAG TPA: exosortase H [Thermoanaerobaculia bacterium]|nr:exosortase H [Thermoanaerobaculia bacterium]